MNCAPPMVHKRRHNNTTTRWMMMTLVLHSPLLFLPFTKAFISQNILSHRSSLFSSSSPPTLFNNEDLVAGIAAIDASNDELLGRLERLRDQPYFRYYSVDILASCEYIPQEFFECYTDSCEIYPEDEETIPEAIRVQDREEHYFELDGWSRWDMPTDDYYDIELQKEGYTGYDGSEVWNFIHQRICFDKYDYDDDHWKADFNKAVSGLHAMVSAQIVRGIREKLEAGEAFSEKEVWRDPAVEFERRLGKTGETPLAKENLYFCYMLLLRAVHIAQTRLARDCQTGKVVCPIRNLQGVLRYPLLEDAGVAVASAKVLSHVQTSDAVAALWEARMRCRDLLRIMNCVQCNKCRLHGKIAVLGLSTAFQILVGQRGEGGDPEKVHRVELAALMTTLHKFSLAVELCHQMEDSS